MADREKVIKEFELFIKEFHPACTSEGVELDMFREVLAMLKEQEPQSVIVHEEPKNGNILWFADCPKCKHGIERDKHKHFCGFCGQEVKWE